MRLGIISQPKHYQPYILLIKIFKKENLFVFKGNMESSHKLKWQTEEIYYLILYIFSASIFTTPLFGISLGVLAYLYLNEEILK